MRLLSTDSLVMMTMTVNKFGLIFMSVLFFFFGGLDLKNLL